MSKKPKKCNFILVNPNDDPEAYKLMDEIREEQHSDIAAARIACAWRVRQKADVDGHLVLGKCVKVSDLYKEFADFDFIIVLNKEVWDSIEFNREKKLALLDHELCHAAPAESDDGELIYDERGKQVFRTRKHDIEEFQGVVARHGLYKRDLERFAEVILKKKRQPLFADTDKGAASAGIQ